MLFIKKFTLIIIVIITTTAMALITACVSSVKTQEITDKVNDSAQTTVSKTTNIASESSGTIAVNEITQNPDATKINKDDVVTTVLEEFLPSLEIIEAEFETLKTGEPNPVKIFSFIDKNIKFADTEFADEMIDFVLQFSENEIYSLQDKYADAEIQQKLWADFNGTTDLQILKNAYDKTIAELAKETIDRRYKLERIEGFISPIIDYESCRSYGEFLSEQMNSFIEIMAFETESPSVLDGGVVISLDDFAGRIIKLYEFEEKYPGFIRIYYIVNMLNGKLWVYMGGIDNTPVFNFNNDSIIQARLDDFREKAEKYKGTRFGDKINEYLDLLKSQNYKRTQKIADYIDNLTFY